MLTSVLSRSCDRSGFEGDVFGNKLAGDANLREKLRDWMKKPMIRTITAWSVFKMMLYEEFSRIWRAWLIFGERFVQWCLEFWMSSDNRLRAPSLTSCMVFWGLSARGNWSCGKLEMGEYSVWLKLLFSLFWDSVWSGLLFLNLRSGCPSFLKPNNFFVTWGFRFFYSI